MLAFKLAYKNLVGAGLRTWLNVGVLSFAFVIIVLYNGILDGWNQQARTDTISWEYGAGQLVHEDYDPYDPFSLQDGYGKLDPSLQKGLTPLLIRQGNIYPSGRMLPIILKGIDPKQETLEIPTQALLNSDAEIPVIIGERMAEAAKLKKGDQVLLRWRDKGGTFDAVNITIADVFETIVPTVDNGQVWIPIEKLWEMTGMENEATLFIANENFSPSQIDGWEFKDLSMLLADLDAMIASKKVGSSVMYGLLLTIALLAIFDTQVLSIFRRQREIGTYISLGMTRQQVVYLFTVEGGFNSILATLVGCVWGIPLLIYLAKVGMGMPGNADEMGIAVGERIYPVYGLGLILGTIALVVISATIVSFLPSRKISKMDPVDALKGKIQ
ncbi:FtsX-like permease family protein [Flammeovirgaceae bacterium SG7u.111]|nr:FtsX-like permease family protein [Flammeovirgaceae bacterium SG7u.132]WPO38120.1 FtsX-like permease family protein [Flammeovirgaceae bacterium SG7u.111]